MKHNYNLNGNVSSNIENSISSNDQKSIHSNGLNSKKDKSFSTEDNYTSYNSNYMDENEEIEDLAEEEESVDIDVVSLDRSEITENDEEDESNIEIDSDSSHEEESEDEDDENVENSRSVLKMASKIYDSPLPIEYGEENTAEVQEFDNLNDEPNPDSKYLKKGVMIEVLDSKNNWRNGYIVDITSNEIQVRYHLPNGENQQWIPLNSRRYRTYRVPVSSESKNIKNKKNVDSNGPFLSELTIEDGSSLPVKRGRGRPKGSKSKYKMVKEEPSESINSKEKNQVLENGHSLLASPVKKRGRKKNLISPEESSEMKKDSKIKDKKKVSKMENKKKDSKIEDKKKEKRKYNKSSSKKQSEEEKEKEESSENKKRGPKSLIDKYRYCKILEEDRGTFNKLIYGKDYPPIKFEKGKKIFKYDEQFNVYYAVEMLREDLIVDSATKEQMDGIFIHYLEWDESWDEWVSKEDKNIIECDSELYDRIEFNKDGISARNFRCMVIDYLIEKYDQKKETETSEEDDTQNQYVSIFGSLTKSLTLREQKEIIEQIEEYTNKHYLVKSSETFNSEVDTKDNAITKTNANDECNQYLANINHQYKNRILAHQFYNQRVKGVHFNRIDKITRYREEIEHSDIDKNIRFRFGLFESENVFDILDYDPSVFENKEVQAYSTKKNDDKDEKEQKSFKTGKEALNDTIEPIADIESKIKIEETTSESPITEEEDEEGNSDGSIVDMDIASDDSIIDESDHSLIMKSTLKNAIQGKSAMIKSELNRPFQDDGSETESDMDIEDEDEEITLTTTSSPIVSDSESEKDMDMDSGLEDEIEVITPSVISESESEKEIDMDMDSSSEEKFEIIDPSPSSTNASIKVIRINRINSDKALEVEKKSDLVVSTATESEAELECNSEYEKDMDTDSEGSSVYEYYLKNIQSKSDEEKIKSDEEKIKSDEEKIKSDEEKIKSDEEKIKSDEEKIKSDEEKLKSDEEKTKIESTSYEQVKNKDKICMIKVNETNTIKEEESSENVTLKEEEIITEGESSSEDATVKIEEATNEEDENLKENAKVNGDVVHEKKNLSVTEEKNEKENELEFEKAKEKGVNNNMDSENNLNNEDYIDGENNMNNKNNIDNENNMDIENNIDNKNNIDNENIIDNKNNMDNENNVDIEDENEIEKAQEKENKGGEDEEDGEEDDDNDDEEDGDEKPKDKENEVSEDEDSDDGDDTTNLKKGVGIETMTSFMESIADRSNITEEEAPEEYHTRLAVKRKEEEIKVGTNLTMCKKKSYYSYQKLALEEWISCSTLYTNNNQLYIKQVYCDAQGRLKLSRNWCSCDSSIVREEFYDNFSYLAENFLLEKRVICGHLLPNQDVKLWEPYKTNSLATGPVGGAGVEEKEDLSKITGPLYYCKGCFKRIKDIRYYCTYCEKTEEEVNDKDQETSYNLCRYCIQCNFPSHIHPRLSFAYQTLNSEIHDKQLLAQGHHQEELDREYYHRLEDSINDTTGKVKKEKVLTKKCSFCDEGEYTSGEVFISHFPFIPKDEKLSHLFWAHECCAMYSPGVYKSIEGHWFNVSAALVDARKTKCAECKHRGATIKCFDPGCHKTYHLGCTHKQKSYFEEGMIFWCPYHERLNEELDSWEEKYSCDVCGIEFHDDSWYTCKKCSNDSYFSTFDLCVDCYENSFPTDHDHPKEQFKMIYAKDKKKDLQEKQEVENEYNEKMSRYYYQQFELKRKRKQSGDKKNPSRCIYCNAEITSETPWRYGYNGLVMCEKCFTKAPTQFIHGDDETPDGKEINIVEYNTSSNVGRYAASVEDYAYQYYLTRDLYAKIQTEEAEVKYLKSYGPTDDQLYSLFFDYSYYDIVSRAPRWATHSGTDYHGTWLPQIVRMALKRYTYRNDKVLSNFLGRGTDVIECFLLQRKSCGIDINPTSIQLSQRNLAFAIPDTFSEKDRPSAEHRPILIQGDSRSLKGPLFVDNSYDIILSHPPYKDCVAYSTHIEGDLSRFPDLDDFYFEMTKVVKETWRLLKPNCRCILGIGDNRRGRYYQPVSYQTIRNYIDEGFIIEEIILKRQRYCQASPLGLFLCTQHDFLMFTHEFIVILRKVPHPKEKPFTLKPLTKAINIPHNKSIRLIPSYPSERKSVVIGTVWNLAVSRSYGLQELTLSKALERFGRDNEYWEEVDLFDYQEELQDLCFTHSSCVNDVEENNEYFDEEDHIGGGADELMERDDYTSAISNYELERQKRIQKNNECLVNLGLLMELNKNNNNGSNNYIYFQKIFNTPPETNFDFNEKKLFLIFIPHLDIPSTYIFRRSQMGWINEYRHFIIEQAKAAVHKLKNGGLLIVGGKDVRVGELVDRDGNVYEGSLEDEEDEDDSETEEGMADDKEMDDDDIVDMDISDEEGEGEEVREEDERDPDDLEDGEIREYAIDYSELEEGETREPIKKKSTTCKNKKRKIRKYLKSEYIPLSVLLYEDIVRNVSAEELKLREFFIVTPEGYESDNKIKNSDISKIKEKLKHTYAEYEQEKIEENRYFDGQFAEHDNIRRIAPIVNVRIIILLKKKKKKL